MTNLTNNPASDFWSSWSHDGTLIVFDSDRSGGDTDLYVMSSTGGSAQALVSSPAEDEVPAWR